MTTDKSKSGKSQGPSDKQKAREERLAAALRANLQRRKAQSRAQSDEKTEDREQ